MLRERSCTPSIGLRNGFEMRRKREREERELGEGGAGAFEGGAVREQGGVPSEPDASGEGSLAHSRACLLREEEGESGEKMQEEKRRLEKKREERREKEKRLEGQFPMLAWLSSAVCAPDESFHMAFCSMDEDSEGGVFSLPATDSDDDDGAG